MKNQLLLISFLILASLVVKGQVSISGTVSSEEDGIGLPGVSVLEEGTSNGTVTNIDGEYTLSVSENASVVFSFVGYHSQTISIDGRSTIDLRMKEDIQTLSEIVVIGYGQVKKEDVTGSVTTLGTKEFNQGVTSSPQDLLTGKIAGVSVVSSGGAPGRGSTIRIRGGSSLGGATNDPLIVIDGFPVDDGDVSGLSNPLSTINPNDIESFTVLKDASAAAIYGSRASNGVIIITTKKGLEGKVKYSFNSQVSISQAAGYVDVLSGDEYKTFVTNLVESPEGLGTATSADLLKLGNQNTDWQKAIMRTAVSQNYGFSAKGSLKGVPFRASYGYTDDEGILKNTYVKRHSLSLNLSPSLLDDHLKINVNAKGTLANSSFGNQDAVGAAVNYDPTQPVFNGNTAHGGYFQYTDQLLPDGSMDPNGTANTFLYNPVSMVDLRDNTADVNRLIGNVKLDYKLHFLPDLHANLNVGIDKSSTDGQDNSLPGSVWTYTTFADQLGSYTDYTNDASSELLDFYFNYKKNIGTMHHVDLTAGYSWQHFERGSESKTTNQAGDITNSETEFKSENYLVSFFGRMIYTLNDKYILTASLRRDGSSRFAEDNQWGVFPAMAFAWKIKDEAFLRDVEAVSSLKFRAGYGITGQQGLSPNLADPYYPALSKYTRSVQGASYQFGNTFYNTLRPDAYDVNLKWEETTTMNLGLDFGFFEEKLSGSVDVYQKETNDLLNRIPIADGSNFGNFLVTNVGNMEIKGYEVSLVVRPLTTSDFSWNIGVNMSYNTREITKLNKTDDPTDPGVATGEFGRLANTIQIYTVGEAPNAFYTFQQVFNENGEPVEGLYVDRTGNGGAVASDELNKYHNRTPYADYLFGINSRVSYKNFDFSFSGRLSLGNYAYRSSLPTDTRANLYEPSGTSYWSNLQRESADLGFRNPQLWSDIYIQNASFFRMDNISIGYTLDDVITSGLKARISFTVQNAFVVTDYKGLDPEVDGGIDGGFYPRPRTYLLGLNLNF